MNIQLALDEQPWNVAVTIKLLCLAPSNVNGYLAAKIIGKGSLVQYSIHTVRALGNHGNTLRACAVYNKMAYYMQVIKF